MSDPAPSPDDPLNVLNEAFREAYAARRDAVLSRMGPIIVQIDDRLILRRRDGQRKEGPARTARYHELKAIAHVPLAVYVILAGPRAALEDDARARLAAIQKRIVAVAADLDRRGFTPEQLARQRRILDGTLAFLDDVIAAGGTTPAALADFARAQTPDILGNSEDAARDQIETMHAVVEAWKKEMTEEERQQLRAVVASSHMARSGNVAVQYFSVTLGDTWEGRFDQDGKRVLASEVAFEEAQAFALLGAHVLDAGAAGRFFGEESRLTRDILADAGERILARMFNKEPGESEPRAQGDEPSD